jgi:hydrogenase expression/formation protein HypE
MTPATESSLAAQLERIDRARVARAARAVLRDEHITLSHGAGGKASHALLDALIAPALGGGDAAAGVNGRGENRLDTTADAALVVARSHPTANGDVARLAFTTDSYVVSPLFFPGGDIGKLAVHGTINDLAMAGAHPLVLSVALIIEEGFEIDVLRRVLASAGEAARAAGVAIVAGDTKVVPRGKADGLFVNTSGIGVIARERALAAHAAEPGDVVLVSGYVGDHGMAVMLAREALEMEAEILSDSAPLHTLAGALLDAAPHTRVLKDPTRGGVGTALNEIASAAAVSIVVDEESVPVRAPVRGACEMLGIDPLHIANEGKLIAIVPPSEGEAALAALRNHSLGADAAVIGRVERQPEGMVILRTPIGGSRVLDMLVGDPLPRIC